MMIDKKIFFHGKNLSFELRDDADLSVFEEIFVDGDYDVCKKYLENLEEGFVLDIGGHAGFFSIWASLLNSKVKVLAFEPFLENVAAFKNNLKKNRIVNVQVKNKGVAVDSGVRDFYLSDDSINHSLFIKCDKSVKVEVEGIKELLGKALKYNVGVDLLKIDAEGVEFEIFEVLDENDLEKVGAIILEYHLHLGGGKNLDWLVSRMKKFGFSISKIPSRYDNNLGMIWAVK